jgi:DNA-directed RNA polymerase specialized sigma24 family protein
METPDLIHAAQHGNLPAFNHLISGYQDQLYTLVCRITAGDLDPNPVVLSIITAAYHDLHSYRGEEFKLWLFRAAVHECRQAMRWANHRGRWNSKGMPAPRASAPEMAESLRGLSLEQRLALTLVDHEKLSYAQAARVAGLSAGKIRRHLGEARFALLELGKNNAAVWVVPNR